jgi:hypothetical protein
MTNGSLGNTGLVNMEITAAIHRLLKAYSHLHPEIVSIEVRCQRDDGIDACILSVGRDQEQPDLSGFET